MRVCTKCGGDGPFYKDSSRSYKQSCWCKNCRIEDQRARLQTPHGRAVNSWAKINERALNKNGKNPSYKDIECRVSREDFINWFVGEMVNYQGNRPSVDRIDNKGHYELGNLQILEMPDNVRKAWRERKERKNVS